MKRDSLDTNDMVVFSEDFSLKQLAEKNNVPIKEILHVLSHEDLSVWEFSRIKPVVAIVSNPESVREAIEHIKEDDRPLRDILKYILWSVYLSLILLLIFARKHIRKIRNIIMMVVVLFFGIALGATPNPMESLVKLFKLLNNMEGDPKILISSFILFTLFSLIGSKFICSWGCQLGALQENLFNIPVFKRKYAVKVPFVLSLCSRIIIFIVFLVLLFGFGYGVVFGIRNFVIYHHLNYFKVFNFHDLAIIALYTLPLFVLLSLFVYRPFCHFICPFGLYSWILENVALSKIRINEEKCIKCEKCVISCPTEAMKEIYNHKRKLFLPDCWSCGYCMDVCPTNAIEYRK